MSKQVNKIFIIVLLALFGVLATPAQADNYYQPSEEVNQIVVTKQIKGLDQAVWKDNYPSDFMVFGPNTQFEFKITVKNTGNRNLTWIKVTDAMPRVLSYIFGRSEASFNSTNYTINWKIPEIKPGEEQTTVLRVTTKGATIIPKALTEEVNKVCVKAESGATDCAESHFWVGNGEYKPGSTLPTTGANPLTWIVTGSALSTAVFFALKKIIA